MFLKNRETLFDPAPCLQRVESWFGAGLDSGVWPKVAFFHLLMVPGDIFSKVAVFAAFLRQKFPFVASTSMHAPQTSKVEGSSHEGFSPIVS